MGKPTPTATRIDSNVKTLENYSYTTCNSGQVAQRTKICDGVSPSGLSIAGRITVVPLTATGWTALPATALTDRNAMGVQNQSGTEIKINYDNTEANYIGIIVGAGGERFWDITDSITVYARAESGTPNVVVEEIS